MGTYLMVVQDSHSGQTLLAHLGSFATDEEALDAVKSPAIDNGIEWEFNMVQVVFEVWEEGLRIVGDLFDEYEPRTYSLNEICAVYVP